MINQCYYWPMQGIFFLFVEAPLEYNGLKGGGGGGGGGGRSSSLIISISNLLHACACLIKMPPQILDIT